MAGSLGLVNWYVLLALPSCGGFGVELNGPIVTVSDVSIPEILEDNSQKTGEKANVGKDSYNLSLAVPATNDRSA
jgi:hypothetical protein